MLPRPEEGNRAPYFSLLKIIAFVLLQHFLCQEGAYMVLAAAFGGSLAFDFNAIFFLKSYHVVFYFIRMIQ